MKNSSAPVGTATGLPALEGTDVSTNTFVLNTYCVPGIVLSARTRPREDGISVLSCVRAHYSCHLAATPRGGHDCPLYFIGGEAGHSAQKGPGKRSLQSRCPCRTVQDRLRLMS